MQCSWIAESCTLFAILCPMGSMKINRLFLSATTPQALISRSCSCPCMFSSFGLILQKSLFGIYIKHQEQFAFSLAHLWDDYLKWGFVLLIHCSRLVYSGFINDLGSFTLRQGYYANVNVNVNLHSALLHSASNAIRAPSTVETDASSVGDRSWRCWDLIAQIIAKCVADGQTIHGKCRSSFLDP